MIDHFTLLCADLGLRKDNSNSGSGIGGNYSEYFYLLTHEVSVVEGDEFFFEDGANDSAIFHVKKDSSDIKKMRAALTTYLSTKIIDEVSDVDMSSSEWVEYQINKFNYKVKLTELLNCIKLCDLIKTCDNFAVENKFLLNESASLKEETIKLFDNFKNYSIDISTFCIRKKIGIDYVIYYNMDEIPVVKELMSKINSLWRA